MNYKIIYGALKNKATREILINKIDNGLKTVSKDTFKPDKEKDQIDREFLINWKSKTKEEQKNFAKEILNNPNLGFNSGFNYGFQKKEEIKKTIKESPGSLKQKIKRGVDKAFKK